MLGTKDRDSSVLDEIDTAVECEETLFCSLRKGVVSHCEKENV